MLKDAHANRSQVLHDEAESFVRKLWRMLIFLSESEKRGLSD